MKVLRRCSAAGQRADLPVPAGWEPGSPSFSRTIDPKSPNQFTSYRRRTPGIRKHGLTHVALPVSSGTCCPDALQPGNLLQGVLELASVLPPVGRRGPESPPYHPCRNSPQPQNPRLRHRLIQPPHPLPIVVFAIPPSLETPETGRTERYS